MRFKRTSEIIDIVISYLRDHYVHPVKNLTNSESQLITQIAYNKHFNLINRTSDSGLDNVLSTIQYKESEDSYFTTELYSILSDYFSLDIYKFTGLTYKDYMTISKEESEILKEFILEIKSIENKKMENIENSLNSKSKRVSNAPYDDMLYDIGKM